MLQHSPPSIPQSVAARVACTRYDHALHVYMLAPFGMHLLKLMMIVVSKTSLGRNAAHDVLNFVQDKTEVPAEEDEKQKPRFELGQRVLVQHESLKEPVPAVVVGWDACCAENDEWKERNDLGRLDMVCYLRFCLYRVSCGNAMFRALQLHQSPSERRTAACASYTRYLAVHFDFFCLQSICVRPHSSLRTPCGC